jgi:hypothetical protein
MNLGVGYGFHSSSQVDRLKAIPAEKRTWRVQQEIKAFQLAEQADVSSGVVARNKWQKACASSWHHL